MSTRYYKSWLLIGVLACSVAVFSCKKDDKGLRPLESGSYIYDKTDDFGSVRMFTKNGEVKDQGLISQYKTQYADQFNTPPANSNSRDTFKVVDEYYMQFVSGSSATPKNFEVSKKDDHYQFRNLDTSKYYTQQIDYLLLNVGKYKPYYEVKPAPMGYNTLYTLQYYYASPGQNSLVFPFINVIRFANITIPGGYNNFYIATRISNVFDEKFPLNTLTNDTVLIQSYNVHCKKVVL